MKKKQVALYLTEQEHMAIKNAALYLGLSVSQFIRSAASIEAKKTNKEIKNEQV